MKELLKRAYERFFKNHRSIEELCWFLTTGGLLEALLSLE